MNLRDYGFDQAILNSCAADGITPARVTAVHRERFELICEYGQTSGVLKAAEYYGGVETFPTTGDFVLIDYNPSGDSRITATLPRKSKFARNDFSGHGAGYVKTVKEQIVAANFDFVFIMQSLNQNYNPKRLERYLTLAWQSGGVPVIILTKTDLAADYSEQLEQIAEIAPGVDVFPVSAKTGDGLDTLQAFLKPGATAVFLGSSGVGKSSLINALAGYEIMSVSEIREDDGRGRHTTTHRQLVMLPCGTMIIDTLGMRELGMWDVTEGLGEAFADVEQYFGKCRFTDCRHQTEPGCAVKAAIESGRLSQERWDSYCALKGEVTFADDKAAYLRGKQQWHKNIAKVNKQRESAHKKYGEKF